MCCFKWANTKWIKWESSCPSSSLDSTSSSDTLATPPHSSTPRTPFSHHCLSRTLAPLNGPHLLASSRLLVNRHVEDRSPSRRSFLVSLIPPGFCCCCCCWEKLLWVPPVNLCQLGGVHRPVGSVRKLMDRITDLEKVWEKKLKELNRPWRISIW